MLRPVGKSNERLLGFCDRCARGCDGCCRVAAIGERALLQTLPVGVRT
jgi:hypothetical protein